MLSDDRLSHLADIPPAPSNVRYWGIWIGRMKTRTGIKLAARTMAGAATSVADTPTKRLRRVIIGTPFFAKMAASSFRR
jgi:hypothetical protein